MPRAFLVCLGLLYNQFSAYPAHASDALKFAVLNPHPAALVKQVPATLDSTDEVIRNPLPLAFVSATETDYIPNRRFLREQDRPQ
ncbi:hypothetical protein [Sedimenticola selenatireducens]|uniref:hypothetical protein n=1 Tax=Sedimenticola selenatireducens TaxID=191960 RepID=UPI003F4AC33B